MYHLDISDLVIKVPTRIYERIEDNPVLRKIKGTDRSMEIMVELGGIQYACSFDNSTKLIDALEALEKGKELVKPDYADRWSELTGNREVVDRHIVLSSYLTSPRTSALGIKAIGLDPNDAKGYFIKVLGKHKLIPHS